MHQEPTTPTDAAGLAVRVALLKALADPTRLQVLDLLAAEGERCHCDLEQALDVPASRLSFHLRMLRDAGLVGTRRHGRWVSYHLHADALAPLQPVLRGEHTRNRGQLTCCPAPASDLP